MKIKRKKLPTLKPSKRTYTLNKPNKKRKLKPPPLKLMPLPVKPKSKSKLLLLRKNNERLMRLEPHSRRRSKKELKLR